MTIKKETQSAHKGCKIIYPLVMRYLLALYLIGASTNIKMLARHRMSGW